MRRTILAGVTVLALAAPALAQKAAPGDGPTVRGFKPMFVAFGDAHFRNPHFAGPPPLLSRDCEDLEPDGSVTCFYSVGRIVDVEAESAIGTDRLAKVTVIWAGSDRRQDLFAETAGFTVGALSPDAPEGAWADIARTIDAALPMTPFTFAPLEWRIGVWNYRFWHDGRFGARDTVRFEATRDPL